MGFRRKFHGHPVVRLIVSVPVEVVEEVDDAIGYGKPWGRNHPARRNRSEFVRLAIVEKLEREFREGGTTTPGGYEKSEDTCKRPRPSQANTYGGFCIGGGQTRGIHGQRSPQKGVSL